MPGYALSVEQHQALKKTLVQLSKDMEAKGLILSDYGGNILVEVLPEGNQDGETLAALAVGSFVATRELAKLVGEKEFRWVFHMGHKTSIYIQCVAAHYLLFAILGNRITQGLAKLYVEKASAHIGRILQDTQEPFPASLSSNRVVKTEGDVLKPAR